MVNAFDFHLRRPTAGTPTICGLGRCFSFSFRGLCQVPVVSFRRCIHFVKIHPGVRHPDPHNPKSHFRLMSTILETGLSDLIVTLPWHFQMLLSGKLTWNLKMDPWKERFLLETIIFRFHVSFQWCLCASPFLIWLGGLFQILTNMMFISKAFQCVNPFDGTLPLHRIPWFQAWKKGLNWLYSFSSGQMFIHVITFCRHFEFPTLPMS